VRRLTARTWQPVIVRFIDRLLDPGKAALERVQRVPAQLGGAVGPAWRRVTAEESRVPAAIAIGIAIVLQFTLASRVANRPRWLFAALPALLLVAMVAVDLRKLERHTKLVRAITLALIAVMSIANMVSGARLVIDLVNAEGIRDPSTLLLTGGSIWLVNVIVFSLWYWEFDRGGLTARAMGAQPFPDFLFPQMEAQHDGLAPATWEPGYVDYLYLSFTNAMAFSPTDVMPMTRWAKLTMLVQSLVSLLIAVLVIARAVNILK
jgi:uncharacterized membrane protein